MFLLVLLSLLLAACCGVQRFRAGAAVRAAVCVSAREDHEPARTRAPLGKGRRRELEVARAASIEDAETKMLRRAAAGVSLKRNTNLTTRPVVRARILSASISGAQNGVAFTHA